MRREGQQMEASRHHSPLKERAKTFIFASCFLDLGVELAVLSQAPSPQGKVVPLRICPAMLGYIAILNEKVVSWVRETL